MRAEGRVKAIGLCNVTLAQYHECSSIARVDALQVAVNVLRPGDAALRRAAYDEGTLVLAFSPMESGLLTGTFDHARVQALPSDDWRKRSPKFGPEALVSAAHIVSALTKVSRRTGYPVPALAVAWSLRQNGVSASIVGARDPRQIAEWREAPSINLEPQDWAEVDSLARTERG
jgi:aryl-alcohol dehydrogenase-like predicted oxidoreductase